MRISDWSSDVCSSDLAAWALLLVGAALGIAGNGAWGAAMASLFGMGMAALLLAQAAAASRPGKTRASDRKAHMLPVKGEPRRIGRRLLTFLVTVPRSEEHTSELQSLMRISYAVFCLQKKNIR